MPFQYVISRYLHERCQNYCYSFVLKKTIFLICTCPRGLLPPQKLHTTPNNIKFHEWWIDNHLIRNTDKWHWLNLSVNYRNIHPLPSVTGVWHYWFYWHCLVSTYIFRVFDIDDYIYILLGFWYLRICESIALPGTMFEGKNDYFALTIPRKEYARWQKKNFGS